MKTPKIFESEYHFMEILWDHEPINSTELVRLCKAHLDWSKATTYTVIRRLAERGAVKNENALVTSLISREEVQASEIDELVTKRFRGSLPAFISAFARHEKLSEADINELEKMISDYRKGK